MSLFQFIEGRKLEAKLKNKIGIFPFILSMHACRNLLSRTGLQIKYDLCLYFLWDWWISDCHFLKTVFLEPPIELILDGIKCFQCTYAGLWPDIFMKKKNTVKIKHKLFLLKPTPVFIVLNRCISTTISSNFWISVSDEIEGIL